MTASSAPDESLRPGLTIDVSAMDLDRDGCGLARWQDWVIVVPDLLPGETARVQLQQRQRSRWRSRRLELLTASPARRRPPCILASDCGGCTLQHLEDREQLHWKRSALIETMRRIGGIVLPPEQTLASPDRALGYRNRALIPLQRGPDGRLRLGYYKRGSHRIINLNRCPVLDPRLDALVRPLKEDLQQSGWPADHDLLVADGLRHLGLRIGHHSGEVLISLVSSHAALSGLADLADHWRKRWPQVRGVTLNLQPKRNNRILGDETVLISGDSTITETVCQQVLELGTTTFFQVNTPEAEAIIQVLLDWMLQQSPGGRVIDAYCGIGTISVPLAASGFDVIGIELHPSSIQQANDNAYRNGLQHRCRFLAGDVGEHLAVELPAADLLVVDPPRRGLERAVIEAIQACPPLHLAYLSCDPATQARDLKMLLEPGGPFRLQRLQPVDFFPQTSHLESLALMERISCAVPPETASPTPA